MRSGSFPSNSFSLRVASPLSPESLPLHDVPQLAQVGLGDEVVRFELQSSQVVGLRFGEFSVQVEDGAEVHQSSWVLRNGTGEENKDETMTGR